MRPISIVIAVFAATSLTFNFAFAQTQQQQNRLNEVARFVVVAPMCKRLGMETASDLPEQVEAAVLSETSTWSIDTNTLNSLKSDALNRQMRAMKIDLGTAVNIENDNQKINRYHEVVRSFAKTCILASKDAYLGKVIQIPSDFDLDKAVIYASDSFLEPEGIASWQNPYMQARADLLTISSQCRAQIGPSRADAIVLKYGQAVNPRERAYYNRAIDTGLEEPTTTYTRDDCDRIVRGFEARVNAAKRLVDGGQ